MRKYGLIGKNLDHSLSGKIYNARFEAEASDESFHLFPLPAIDAFPELVRSTPGLTGLAVTIPYKQTVIPYLHQLHATAAQTGAVNCITLGDVWVGYNTDIFGFEQSLIPYLKPHHNKALVLGTGGAARAVQTVLKKLGIPFQLLSRNKNNGLVYGDVNKDIASTHTLWINCTPLGTIPDVHARPEMHYDAITPQHLLYDLVYNPAITAFMREGLERGATVKNGMEMLQLQAEENLRIWRSAL